VIKLSFIFTVFSVSILGHKDTHSLNQELQTNLKTGWYYIEDSKNDYLRPLDRTDEQYYVNPDRIKWRCEPAVNSSNFQPNNLDDSGSPDREWTTTYKRLGRIVFFRGNSSANRCKFSAGEGGEGTLKPSAFIFKLLGSGDEVGHRIFHRMIWVNLNYLR
jgi:hypothetical protein